MKVEVFFSITILIYIAYRLWEMKVAVKNQKKLIKQFGSIEEVGQGQRLLMLILHTSWFVSLILEFSLNPQLQIPAMVIISCFFLLVSAWLRAHSMGALGIYWNTKIFKLKTPLIKSGVYKFFCYPNYLGVIIEFIFLPLLFKLYFTLIFFSIFNMIFLFFRIKLQNETHLIRTPIRNTL